MIFKGKNIKSRTWSINFLFILSTMLFFTAFINYYIDPFWFFKHQNNLNSKQKVGDERHNKLNDLYNNGLQNYNGLLLGNSRSTYINQFKFYNDFKIYNFATSSMDLIEYNSYIQYLKKIKDSEFKYIILGLDFHNTNLNKNKLVKDPEYYIEKVEDPFYLFKTLLSYDTVENSLKNISYSFKDKKIYYDRNNIHYSETIDKIKLEKRQRNGIIQLTKNFMNSNYQWDSNYKKRLIELKKNNPETKFIIFTSPISSELIYSIIINGEKLDEYYNWLKDTIEVFNEVSHYMFLNDITTNLNNYFDSSHYYPFIGDIIAKDLSSLHKYSKHKIILNKSNLDTFFNDFKNNINKFKSKYNIEKRNFN
ncbi:hypothetical protein LPB137_09850 [Poseidonibacter parvus]|uniref:Uncharacterized protein n=1 Tax=Poseidonibacter parvus TaxID=1850254 RepID=A0A1P8KNN1_9BACT|nr:hypothetical protein [Poseidonibacter parvus]APW66136.1 hypothetical protein LPB137_09850 [Poseidonibacter parvus]